MDKITFLGTGGARIMLSRQLLATAGIWICFDNTTLHLDPGPGALVHAMARGFAPKELDGILLSHRHLDHCGDVNALIEAMTSGGLKRQGKLFAPEDALENDPVVLRYLRGYLDEITVIRPLENYRIGNLTLQTSAPHRHGVETYGMTFRTSSNIICYLPDTAYFPELKKFYQGNIFIVSMLLSEPNNRIAHLAVPEVEEILMECRPKLTILTHFGLQIFREGPDAVAHAMSQRTGLKIIAAHDGSQFEF